MRKNSNGHGSIRKRIINGRVYFEARYTDPVTHKQKSVSATTESECSQKLLQVLASITTGSFVTPQKLTVSDWMDRWLEQKKQHIQVGTYSKYESASRIYIVPRLGRAKLQDLRRLQCQEFVDGLTEIAPKTVHNIAGVLSDALQDAVRLEMIPRNPASDLNLPRITKKEPLAMTTDLQRKFETAVKESPYCNVYLVALHTGARISEVLGLQWRNIDMKTGEMKITGQLERKSGTTERALKNTTKSHRDRVTIAPPFVIAFLKDERRRQNEHKLQAGCEWSNPDGLVFTRPDGSPLPHRTVEHAFDRIKQRLGHPELTLHALRRTYITNQVHAGEDIKTIAAAVGHASTDITLTVYTAQRREDMQKSADRRQLIHDQNTEN